MVPCLRSGHCPRCHAGQGRRSVSAGQRPSDPVFRGSRGLGRLTPATATDPFVVLLKPRPDRSTLPLGVPHPSLQEDASKNKNAGPPPTLQHPGFQTSGSSSLPPAPSSESTPNFLFQVLGPQYFIPNAAALNPNLCPRSGFNSAPGLSCCSRHPGSPITSPSAPPHSTLNPKSSILFPAYCF